ncbi:MAG TPA: GNAT family N-acetyltransferase [Terriglobales bacterium]|nr:GNAT family N-acetyltransferase [Terriglobales bacterium]
MNSAMRFGDAADVDAIAALVNAAFNRERFYISGDRTNPNKIADLLRKGRFILYHEKEQLAGCVYIEITGERGYLGLLSVDPERQRSGLGTELVAAAEEYGRKAGCRFMDLTFAHLRRPLLAYYLHLGYEENGTLPFPREQHQPNQPVHLVKMSKEL